MRGKIVSILGIASLVLVIALFAPAIPTLGGPQAYADTLPPTATPTQGWTNSGRFNVEPGRTAHYGPLWFFIPDGVVPEGVPNSSSCALKVQQGGGKANFSFDGVLYTIRVICPTGVLTSLAAPITICYSGDVTVMQKPWHGSGFVTKSSWLDDSGRTCISISDF